MSVAARRFRAGDVILASGSLLLLVAILAHVAAAPAAPQPGRTAPGSDLVSAGAPDGAAVSPSIPESASGASAAKTTGDYEPPSYLPNSRTIRTWKDLPVHVVHRPHWISGRTHPKRGGATGIDYQLRTDELHLEVLGFDADSVKRGLEMVDKLDATLLDVPVGVDVTQRLLRLATGGKEAAELAASLESGGGEESVRVRAIALLAGRGTVPGVAEFLRSVAKSDAEAPIRSAAGVSMLWLGRQGDVAEWVGAETSSRAVSDFFDSIQSGVHKLQEPRPPKTLIFEAARAIESSPLVDALMEGAGSGHWDSLTRAKMYGVAALYGGERVEVGVWMTGEYERAGDDLTRASILFTAPDVANFRGLEEKAIEVARAGGSGYLVRTALFSLGRFRTERSFRALLEIVPKTVDDTARHAVRALVSLEPWHGKEIAGFLRQVAAGHPNATLREEAAAALRSAFRDYPQ